MSYNASYTDGDIASATVDTIVKALLTVASFVTLIVLVYMFVWLKKKIK